jgi:uncharacterized protein (DUF2344 family)
MLDNKDAKAMEEKFKKMNSTELISFINSSKLASRIMSFFGIGILLFVLFFSNILITIAGSISVGVLAAAGAALDSAKNIALARLENCRNLDK